MRDKRGVMRGMVSVVLLAGSVLWCGGCRSMDLHDGEVEVTEFRPQTADGWEIELKRYRAGRPDSGRLPVILCHGRTSNGKTWDMTPELSLARYLARQGYDVWVPNLRGTGTSSKTGFAVIREMLTLRVDNARQLVNVPRIANPARFGWTFDDYCFQDLPAIIDTVKRESGQQRVLWVGLSMGGMVIFPYLDHAERDAVAGFVALGSPVYMPQPPNDLYQLLVRYPRMFQVSTALLNNHIPSVIGGVAGYEAQATFFYSPENMDREVVRKYLIEGTEDTSTGVTGQMLGMLKTGHLKSADEKVDYTADLDRVTVPALLVSAKADNMCEPTCVRYAYEHVGSTDKTYRELGLANNFSADYGHIDIVLGKNAPREVYPLILDWLRQHDRP